jgi:LPPG:FO 2-phospho-L-lactate transferase
MERITVLAGGVGGARFVRGLLSYLARQNPSPGGGSTAVVTVVANTGDDMWLHGLRVCPDLDTIMYTLGEGIEESQGWGRAGDSTRTSSEIAAYGRGWGWFTLGDLDLGTHIVRTELLRDGATLTEATETLCRRWRPGVELLPMSDQPVETHVRLARSVDGHQAGELIHFEEWWVRYRAGIPVIEFVQVGLNEAAAAPGVIEAVMSADAVLIPPSNPIVSVGTILAVPGIRDAVQRTAAAVIGVSPIIQGSAVRGMAEQCLSTVGIEATAVGVGLHYGARNGDGILDGWLVDTTDARALPALEDAGIRSAAVPLWMTDVPATAAIAAEALTLARSAYPPGTRTTKH